MGPYLRIKQTLMGRTVTVATGPGNRSRAFRAKGGKSTRKIAKKALSLARSNVSEMKHFDVAAFVAAAPDAWGISSISVMATGDNQITRDGDEVQNMSIQYKGSIVMHATAVSTQVRILLIQDRMAHAAIPLVADVFSQDNIRSFLSFEPANRYRFKVLSDRTYHLSDALQNELQVNVFKRIYGKQFYNADTATTAGIGKNSLYLAVCSSEATNEPTLDIDTRFVWRDV